MHLGDGDIHKIWSISILDIPYNWPGVNAAPELLRPCKHGAINTIFPASYFNLWTKSCPYFPNVRLAELSNMPLLEQTIQSKLCQMALIYDLQPVCQSGLKCEVVSQFIAIKQLKKYMNKLPISCLGSFNVYVVEEDKFIL